MRDQVFEFESLVGVVDVEERIMLFEDSIGVGG